MSLIKAYKYNKQPPLSGLYSIKTANEQDEVWRYLRRFTSEPYVRQVLKGQITLNSVLIKDKSEQIAFTLRQSEEYFMSARRADISIKPLLLYYGLVGLAKCLIMSGDNQYTLNTDIDSEDHATHGISWKANLTTPEEIKVRDSLSLVGEFCKVKPKGLYPLFRSCYANTPIPDGTRINIQTLLSLIGENWNQYYHHFRKPPNVYRCDHPVNGGVEIIGDNKQMVGGFDHYFYMLHRKSKRERLANTVLRIFPELSTIYRDENGSSQHFKSIGDVTSMDSHIVFSYTQTKETYALIQPIAGFKLTDFDVYFLLFFILSNIARYRQDKWFGITQRRGKSDEFFLIENVFEIVQTKIPLLVLRELEGKDISFIGRTGLIL